MENIVLNITIGERSKSEAYLNFFKEQDINLSLATFGRGTASKEVLEMLGIGSSDKCVIFSFMTMRKSHELLIEIEKRMQLKKVGAGLSLSVPLSSIDGMRSLRTIVSDIDVEKEDEGYMVNTEKELIVVVAKRGYTETVMEVARRAGAEGGTVVHARGTGQESSEKFFGTLIGAEKEMIFIVSKTEKRNNIMKEIKENVGAETPSGAVSFSLPISEISGFLENSK